MHVDYIKQYGLDSYYAIMGVDNDKTHNSFKDDPTDSNSSTFSPIGITGTEPTWSFEENFLQPSHDRGYQNFNGNNI